jgi:pimeloyl-ACP methyl ester carboxylesterase
MMPGLDGTGIMFRPLLREFKGAVDPVVISYDQEECSYQALVDKVTGSLPRNDFFMLGESFSGPIALMIAGQKPEGLKGIILCASFITNPSAMFPSFLSFLVQAPLFSAWPVSLKADVLTGGRGNGQIKELMREAKGKTKNKALASRTREVLRVNVAEQLRQCRYPILYLKGARDLVVRGHNLRKIKKIKKDVSDVTLDTSHLVLQEAPHDSAKEILKFIKSATDRRHAG